MVYDRSKYNVSNETEQWIRLGDGCPNNCAYCYCPTDIIQYEIPEINRNKVKIMDMNLLCYPNALEIIKELGTRKVNGKVVYYELICGIDHRFLTLELAIALKESRFKNIRFAWDYGYHLQKVIKKSVDILKKAGYKPKEISIFVLSNWKTPYCDCIRKLDLMKIWNVKVNDCWFDNQLPPKIKPIHWTYEQCKNFRRLCRKHNQMVLFGIDPELKYIRFM